MKCGLSDVLGYSRLGVLEWLGSPFTLQNKNNEKEKPSALLGDMATVATLLSHEGHPYVPRSYCQNPYPMNPLYIDQIEWSENSNNSIARCSILVPVLNGRSRTHPTNNCAHFWNLSSQRLVVT